MNQHVARQLGPPKHITDAQRQQEARTSTSALIGAFAQADPEIDLLLGPAGPIAQALPHYRPRHGQIHLAQQMGHALRLRKQLLGEAGTGIGKSLAYLVVGILHALRSGQKVLVATANLALQDQIRLKDLPFLQDALREHLVEGYGRNFSWAVMKGKSNSVCLLKANGISGELHSELEQETETLETWLDETTTGDLAELPFDIKQDRYWPLRQAYTAEGEEDCPGERRCDYGGQCYYYRSRRAAQEADVVIVNHALVVIDAILGNVLLPPYDVLILDEAHQFEDYVRSMTEKVLSPGRVNRLLKKASKLVDHDLEFIRTEARGFFDQVERAVVAKLPRDQRKGEVSLATDDLPAELLEQSRTFGEVLYRLKGRLEQVTANEGTTKRGSQAESLAKAVAMLKADVEALGEQAGDYCLWGEVTALDKPPTLKLTMVNVAPFCSTFFWRQPAILTSATLATGGEDAFAYQRETLGLTKPLEVQIESPYDYRRQALYYVPNIPESVLERRKGEHHTVGSRRFSEAIAPHVLAALQATNGRAFVLFTSYEVMRQTRDILGGLPWDVRSQGDMAKMAIVDWFKQAENPVLFATSSFWEGVDIPGSQLELVIIDRIPVPNPTQPVMKARLEKAGQQGFWEISVPRATMALKQAVGRLIRRETDRGLIMLCDPRFRTKGYAKGMLRALPGRPEVGVSTLDPESLAIVPTFLANAPRAPKSEAEEWAGRALATLAGLDPDRAGERNDVGFNGSDTAVGHSLAEQLRLGLTPKQWNTAVQLCRKYHKQIGRCPEVA